jgi:hypothetical protein
MQCLKNKSPGPSVYFRLSVQIFLNPSVFLSGSACVSLSRSTSVCPSVFLSVLTSVPLAPCNSFDLLVKRRMILLVSISLAFIKKEFEQAAAWEKRYEKTRLFKTQPNGKLLGTVQYECERNGEFSWPSWTASLFRKQNYNVLSPNLYIHVSVRDLYIPRISLPILLQLNRQSKTRNI